MTKVSAIAASKLSTERQTLPVSRRRSTGAGELSSDMRDACTRGLRREACGPIQMNGAARVPCAAITCCRTSGDFRASSVAANRGRLACRDFGASSKEWRQKCQKSCGSIRHILSLMTTLREILFKINNLKSDKFSARIVRVFRPHALEAMTERRIAVITTESAIVCDPCKSSRKSLTDHLRMYMNQHSLRD